MTLRDVRYIFADMLKITHENKDVISEEKRKEYIEISQWESINFFLISCFLEAEYDISRGLQMS